MGSENKWFDGIPIPGDGLGYLDHLIVGHKQFLVKNKKEPARNNKQHHTKRVEVEVDDIKWIEERKKKFPKVGGDTKIQASTVSTHSNVSNSNLRRKTLFQKLMEMDTP